MLGFLANCLIGFMGVIGIALFIALVICIVLCTLLMRSLMSFMDAPAMAKPPYAYLVFRKSFV